MKNYEATAQRDGEWWSIEVTTGLPKNRFVLTQARRINEIEPTVRDAIALLLNVDESSFTVTITYILPANLQIHRDLYDRAEELDAAARLESANARSRAAAGLTKAGFTLRETAALLGLSFQRVKQLVDRAPDSNSTDPLQQVNERLAHK